MSIQTQLYSTLPIWLQHCAVSAQGFRFRTWRNNPRRMDRYLSDLLVSQHWSAEQFLECQTVLLRQTLENAFEHVPYYRDLANELGCRAADFAAPDAFQKFPVLDKSTVRGHEGEFYATNIPGWKCWRGGTSGTTGTPLALRTTSDAMARAWAFVARLRRWAGVENPCLPRRVQFTGRNIVPGTQSRLKHVYWRHNWPGRALLMSTCHISRETIRSYVAAMTRFAPELIDGYPSALIAVVRSARFVGVELPTPRAIITTAETLEPAIKQEIEEAFRCNVFNQYAASEPSCLWGTCEAGTMHISPEYGISEILGRDGKAAKPGEEGEVVVTSFLNPAMPLIRYRLGDMAVLGAATLCACGRAMPIVECVVGRRDD